MINTLDDAMATMRWDEVSRELKKEGFLFWTVLATWAGRD